MDSRPAEPNMETLPYSLNYMPKFVLKICEKELKEKFETEKNSIQELRSLLLNNEITKTINFQDDFLLQYLRRNKHKTKRCFEEIKNFILLRRKEKSMFEKLPDKFLPFCTEIFIVLPKRCPEGCALILIDIGKWDPKLLTFPHFLQLSTMFCLQVLRDPVSQITGFKIIADFQGVSAMMIKHFTPQMMYLLYHASNNCFPLRCKEIHIIHESLPMKILWSMFRPLLSDKISKRIHFHRNAYGLFKSFTTCVIPTKYGGSLQENINMKDFLRKASEDYEKYEIEERPNLY